MPQVSLPTAAYDAAADIMQVGEDFNMNEVRGSGMRYRYPSH